jgi:hypothetical protein
MVCHQHGKQCTPAVCQVSPSWNWALYGIRYNHFASRVWRCGVLISAGVFIRWDRASGVPGMNNVGGWPRWGVAHTHGGCWSV